MTKIAANTYQTIKDLIVKYRRTVVTLVHITQAFLANYLAFVLRFDAAIPAQHLKQFFLYIPYLLIVRLAFYLMTGLYKDLWRYSSINDLIKLIKSVTFSSIVFFIVVRYLFGDIGYPRSIYILDWLVLILLAGGSRLFIRIFREYMQHESSGKRILIIGAGDAGEMLVRDMRNNPSYNYEPIGFIDDDLGKKGLSIHGLPIFGPRGLIQEVIERHKPSEIIIAMPSMGNKALREIYDLCKQFNIPIKILPGMADILEGKISVSQIKPLSLEDLLQREQIRTDIHAVKEYLRGKSVLVTGAGGSIGSELCRQIFEYSPGRLILFDRYENGLFDIDMELNNKSMVNKSEKGLAPADRQIITVVGDMCDASSLENLFIKYTPDIVFHAAAHKHVPLMEHNPLEAVKNNIFGTKNLIEAAARHRANSFVMISTDKAVNPTNIMGATKRVAEYLSISRNNSASTKFSTVRFGNVLGSNGSVVNIFRNQIKSGGPVRVTHPDIKRFFMLIPEAVQLVLIAASSGEGGEIFVLDMGEQINITELAENLIRLSGFTPHEDIQIEFTGLRPGEKLFEELFDESEKMLPTFHEKLRMAIPGTIPSVNVLEEHLAALACFISKNSVDEVIAEIQKIVPNFKRAVH